MSFSIKIYKTEDGKSEIQVNLSDDTVWLSLNQISELFERDKSVVSRHIKNIFKEKELILDSTVAKKATVHQNEGGRLVERNIDVFSLDVIISIGYRVKSNRATQFRIWANKLIKDHLINGYTLNEKRLKQTYKSNLKQLESTIELLTHSFQSKKELQLIEAKGFVEILTRYTQSFIILNKFDEDRLDSDNLSSKIHYQIEYSEAKKLIQNLKTKLMSLKEASNLFGNEKDHSLKGIIGNIEQTFDGQSLYPSIEEKAAHLLYFIIKNHPFSDGNKRIGALLFVWYLQQNDFLFKKTGDSKISENTLVALSLLIAQSDPNQKEIMIKLIINLIKN
ncbi:virulence protein RhuM/Fic/DOC family protein [Muricauda oceani]|uniref:Virulence protein RhuM/Fic/DOC family protein n=1 Tax=Flagellimonas oceani TaxID=2698672 RepID=A0A6G7J4I9_9FLAO|nr:virulence protein RhuM/Fic/DOC family protein [Allomuricauda oceani]MBW8243481.1 virulence protein RhuM/Fic/DOC family protein [Allomuricauda oceani]QII45696.1 virulence protein RhuM/Fic/DOC family protein [Allomuricauda oceani]